MRRSFYFPGAMIIPALSFFAGYPLCINSIANDIAPPGVIFELLALNRDLPTAARPKYLSPIDLVPSSDSASLYVAEQTAKQIAVINIQTNTITKLIKLPNEVTGLAVSPVGSRIYATCSSDLWPAGMVCEVDASLGKVLRRFSAGHGARSPVLSPNNKTLYVCNTFNNSVSVIDLASGKESTRIPVIREPYDAGITPDGSVLVVVNSLPAEKSTDVSTIGCKVSLIDAVTRKVTDTIALPRGSHSAFGLTVSHDGLYAYITHLIGNFTIPAVAIEGGWIQQNNCAIVDIKGRALLNDVSLDRATMGSANPWGIAGTRDGSILCIAHSGSNELSVIDLNKMMDSAKTGADLSHNLGTLYSIRQKVPVAGKTPRALAIIGNKAFTAGYFGDNVEMFDLSLTATSASGAITLGPSQPLTSERKGEWYFSDGTLCYEKWESCSSCHPFGRVDALNWILGSENSATKNASSMLYSWWTPPTSWSGRRRNASEQIRAGIRNVLFIEPDERVAVNIDTFFMNLKPVPSPCLVKGTLNAVAERGKALFMSTKVDCIICHPPQLYTDNKFHNAGVPDPFDGNREWNTPTLVELWRTGPYGHIGSFDKMEDLLKVNVHSKAGSLSDSELRELAEYILSL